MNAAFLLVTTAWFVGADMAPPAGTVATTPTVAAAPVVGSGLGAGYGSGSCCGGGNMGNCCCETCCKPNCFQKLKARFQRNNCCCQSCNTCNTGCGNVGCGQGGCGNVAVSSCGSSCCGNANACCECGCGSGGKFGRRLRGMFNRNNGCCDCCGTSGNWGAGCGGCGGYGAGVGGSPAVMPSAGEPIKAPKDANPGQRLPSGTPGKVQFQPNNGLDVTPTGSKTIETETKNPFELDRRYETRVGRAADYRWVTGQLFFVHADGGLWVLRYAPLWQEDPNGGSVVLARDRQMDSYREGDLVTVHGEILDQKGSIFLGGPLYRTQSIQLIDRTVR